MKPNHQLVLVALGVSERNPYSVSVPPQASVVDKQFSNRGQLLSGKLSHVCKQPGFMPVLRVQTFNHRLLCVNVVLQELALRSAWQQQPFDSGMHAI